jgi:hypothetical protein
MYSMSGAEREREHPADGGAPPGGALTNELERQR